PYKPNFIREVTRDDLLRRMEIKMARILRFNKEKAEELIVRLQKDIADIDKQLRNMVEVTIKWFTMLKEKYGARFPRLTEIRNLDTIVAAKVVEANQKLYINRAEGFIGTSLKKDEFVTNCSDIDDVILFYKDGKYKIVKVSEKLFVGKNIIHIDVFKKNDKRTIYNVVYRDGSKGIHYIKRFAATGMTRDREYDLTQGSPGSKVMYFSSNPNGEAEVIKVMLRPNPRLRNTVIERDFSTIAIKGRQSMGNILTKNEVQRITLKRHGNSTLGGRQVWFDRDILRINFDNHGEYLGEFHNDDKILVILENGDFYLSPIDLNNHYEDNILYIEKYDSAKVWSAVLYDASQQGLPYVKRFTLDAGVRKQNCLGDNKENKLIWFSDTPYPRLQVMFGGNDSFREPLVIELDEFIAVKSYKAKGKRLTTFEIDEILELEPTRVPVVPEPVEDEKESVEDDEIEQPTLFDNEEE
ncbi:MAG: DNA gyrase/topoisomerase IV subunit A, partial [Bacteroidaceae bacterium]|nr:DNA gyrase/topoisomerase IV subunit A [Bacteroidaceae bacterium]